MSKTVYHRLTHNFTHLNLQQILRDILQLDYFYSELYQIHWKCKLHDK